MRLNTSAPTAEPRVPTASMLRLPWACTSACTLRLPRESNRRAPPVLTLACTFRLEVEVPEVSTQSPPTWAPATPKTVATFKAPTLLKKAEPAPLGCTRSARVPTSRATTWALRPVTPSSSYCARVGLAEALTAPSAVLSTKLKALTSAWTSGAVSTSGAPTLALLSALLMAARLAAVTPVTPALV